MAVTNFGPDAGVHDPGYGHMQDWGSYVRSKPTSSCHGSQEGLFSALAGWLMHRHKVLPASRLIVD